MPCVLIVPTASPCLSSIIRKSLSSFGSSVAVRCVHSRVAAIDLGGHRKSIVRAISLSRLKLKNASASSGSTARKSILSPCQKLQLAVACSGLSLFVVTFFSILPVELHCIKYVLLSLWHFFVLFVVKTFSPRIPIAFERPLRHFLFPFEQRSIPPNRLSSASICLRIV